jgi:hypothetical protein
MSSTDKGTENSTGPTWRDYTYTAGDDDPRRAAHTAKLEQLLDPPALGAAWELANALRQHQIEQSWTQTSPGDELAAYRETTPGRSRVAAARDLLRWTLGSPTGDRALDEINGVISRAAQMMQRPGASPTDICWDLHHEVRDLAYQAADAAAQAVHNDLAVLAARTASRLLSDLMQAPPESLAARYHEKALAEHLREHPYLVETTPPTRSGAGAAIAATNALRPRRTAARSTARRAGRPPLQLLLGGASPAAGRHAAPGIAPTRRPEGRGR